MKGVLVKLLLLVSIGSMVVLATLGAYYVFEQSQNPAIIAPEKEDFKTLPSQAPPKGKQPQKPFLRPGFYNQDMPGPKTR